MPNKRKQTADFRAIASEVESTFIMTICIVYFSPMGTRLAVIDICCMLVHIHCDICKNLDIEKCASLQGPLSFYQIFDAWTLLPHVPDTGLNLASTQVQSARTH